MKSLWVRVGYAAIILTSFVVGYGINLDAERKYQSAWQHHLDRVKAEADEQALKIGASMNAIYENLRTLSMLPSVRKIDRHGLALGADGHETIQQVYNNLASNIDVSEVYLLPVDFNPEKLDPFTGKLEEPILMFDELIVMPKRQVLARGTELKFREAHFGDAAEPAVEEVEIHEYRQLKGQIAWFKQRYADRGRIDGLRVPMISGAEVIICDNRNFINTRVDGDRSGVIFSVPFYGADEQLKGMISAIMLTSAVRKLLPAENYVLVSPGMQFASQSMESGRLQLPIDAAPTPHMLRTASLYQTIPVATQDPRGTWLLRTEHPVERFFSGAEFKAIQAFEFVSLIALALTTLAGLGWLTMFRRWNARMLHDANHDSLTGLPNKRMLMEAMGSMLLRCSRGELAAVLYLDLDRFKLVNDTMATRPVTLC